MAQNILYSLWEGTKCPWLCLMTTSLLFSVLWLFSFVSAFLTSLIKLILWLKLSMDKRQAEDTVGARTMGSCSVSLELWGPKLSAMDSRRGDGMYRGTEKGQQMLSNRDSWCCGIQSYETHFGGHSRQWSTVYYASGFKGNHFPTRPLMFLRGPGLYPPLHDWLHVSNFLVVHDWVLQQVGARRTNN